MSLRYLPFGPLEKQGCWSTVGRNTRVLVFPRARHRELVPLVDPSPMSATQVSNGSFWFQGRSTAFVPPIFSLERFSLGVIVIVVLIDKYPADSGFELKSSTFVICVRYSSLRLNRWERTSDCLTFTGCVINLSAKASASISLTCEEANRTRLGPHHPWSKLQRRS